MKRGVLGFEEQEEKGTAVETAGGCLKGRTAGGGSYGGRPRRRRMRGGESMIRIRG